jgi:hypothetical protein
MWKGTLRDLSVAHSWLVGIEVSIEYLRRKIAHFFGKSAEIGAVLRRR